MPPSAHGGPLAPMPIIVGAPRSGTTMLRLMLDAHPDLAIPPETGFLVVARELAERPDLGADAFADVVTAFPPEAPTWPDFGLDADAFRERLRALAPFTAADGLRSFYGQYAERFGKPRWGEKTPGYARCVADIAAVLPEARFIHLIRDGRDVAVSLRKRWFSPGYDIAVQARFWADHVLAAREQGAGVSHYLELRYEDLLAAPERELRGICDFLELRFDPAMLEFHRGAAGRLTEHRDRVHVDGRVLASHEQRLEQQAATTGPPDLAQIGVWKQGLSPEDVVGFEAVAGELLRGCGYATAGDPRSRRRLAGMLWPRRG